MPEQRLTSLTEAVDELTREAREIRAELRRRTHALWVAVLVGGIVLASVLAAAISVSLDNREAISDNNQRWCPMVALLIPRSDTPPPTTPRGIKIATEALRLYDSFGCPPRA